MEIRLLHQSVPPPQLPMTTEIEAVTDSSALMQAQCWEDADTLLAALDVRPGETIVSVGAGADNSLSLLLSNPARVIGVDPNPAQYALCELKTRAYRKLGYGELLELVGSRTGTHREDLFNECLDGVPTQQQAFWQSIRNIDRLGLGGVGRFERELSRFRVGVLPFAHTPLRVNELLQSGTENERAEFFDETWNSLRWRVLFRAAFSRATSVDDGHGSGSRGRANEDVIKGALERMHFLMVQLDPKENPYLHWFLQGFHGDVLPVAYRARNHHTIRERLDRISWRCQSLEGSLGVLPAKSIDRFNLGGVFEPTSEAAYHHLLKAIIRAARPGARLVYWNTLTRRTRPETLREQLRPLDDLSTRLARSDKSPFSLRLVIEEVTG
jgi:S-adenosylmethionine-diacylglycerol 3-amino-3-carboxypropyl transferase